MLIFDRFSFYHSTDNIHSVVCNFSHFASPPMIFSRKITSTIQSKIFQFIKSNMCDIAVCQFTATNNKAENLKAVTRLVCQASSQGAKVAFLPEGCDYIAENADEIRNLAETLDGPTVKEYKNLASTLKIWLSIGGIHELQSTNGDKISNSHILINNCGEIVSVYRKLHLFDVHIPEKNLELTESKYTNRGEEIVPPVNTPAGPLALFSCYDLRFPELSLLQRKNGASILSYPSAFTYTTGKAHWEILLRARAIENQCFVVAAAQYGRHNEKRISYGNSLIVNPWGEIIAQCPAYDDSEERNERIAMAEIDPSIVQKVREEMPVFSHRRKDVYQLKAMEKGLPILKTDQFKFSHIDIPEPTVFYKTKLCYGFTNLRCVVPGHVLVTTRRVIRRLADCEPDEISDLFQTVVTIQKQLEKHFSASSSTICCQDGKEAGQTVSHVHVHILPRRANDFKRNDDIYERLASHDRDDSTVKDRDLSEMTAEAQELRKYFYEKSKL